MKTIFTYEFFVRKSDSSTGIVITSPNFFEDAQTALETMDTLIGDYISEGYVLIKKDIIPKCLVETAPTKKY